MSSPETQPAQGRDRDPSFQAVLDCYLSSIQEIADQVVAIYPEIGVACREQLTRLKARLEFEANLKTLEESRDTLHQALDAFAGRARRYNHALADELNRTVAMVSQSEDSRSARNVQYVEHLVDFVDQMESAVRSGDLSKVADQAIQLRGFAESIELDSRDAVVQLRGELREFELRLREAELLASSDPLTGVANRRELDRQLASRIESRREFCVLMFDLGDFKAVNDQHGHLCGDEVLKQLGARLNHHVRSRDFVCRWGGDEFVVLLDCGLDHAITRSQQIVQWLNGPYGVSVEGREISVDVSVSVGVTEYVAGESPERLFQRVDASMYRHKNGPAAL